MPIGSFIFLTWSTKKSTFSSKRVYKWARRSLPSTYSSSGSSLPSFLILNLLSIQDWTYGLQPRFSYIKYTIPHLETVAGEATRRSYTSNNILIWFLSLILYPFARHNIILSSRTVFIFSIHNASTGPSKTTHYLTLVSSAAWSLMI